MLSQLRSALGTLWGHRECPARAVGRQQIDPWASVLLQRAVLEVWHFCARAVLPLLALNPHLRILLYRCHQPGTKSDANCYWPGLLLKIRTNQLRCNCLTEAFPCPSRKGVTAMGRQALRKALGEAKDAAYRGRTPLHLCESEIRVWIKRAHL